MPLLPRRFERLRSVLNQRMADLTVLVEHVEKPHNLSAILRSCDAVGVLEAHAVSFSGRPRTFNSTAQGSQRWVPLHDHADIGTAISHLKQRGFRLFGTNLSVDARDYRECDFTGPCAFVLGAEKWGLTEEATALMDQAVYIPMRGDGAVAERVRGHSHPAVRGAAATSGGRPGPAERGRHPRR